MPQAAPGRIMSPMTETTHTELDPRVKARARHYVYERLALASTVIWVIGTFILMITIVPYVLRPQPYIFMASIIPIPFAALPWLFWGKLSNILARKWSKEQG